jgi:hypothetical protein
LKEIVHEDEAILGIALLQIALALLIPAAAAAQTYTQLYTYPNTDNNSSGITYESVLSQGQDGELYSTIQTNGANNEGSVYKISTAGQYDLIYSFCAEGGACKLTGGIPDGGVTLGFDGNSLGDNPEWRHRRRRDGFQNHALRNPDRSLLVHK